MYWSVKFSCNQTKRELLRYIYPFRLFLQFIYAAASCMKVYQALLLSLHTWDLGQELMDFFKGVYNIKF